MDDLRVAAKPKHFSIPLNAADLSDSVSAVSVSPIKGDEIDVSLDFTTLSNSFKDFLKFSSGVFSNTSLGEKPGELGSQNDSTPDGNLLKHGTFLATEEVLCKVIDETNKISVLPAGKKKENKYFIIDNEENFKRHQRGEKCIFIDDCGAWDWKKGRTVTTYHELVGKKLMHLFKKGGQFGKEQQTLKTRIFVPSYPQPQNVVTLHRYYALLKRDSRFRRRISFFSSLPGYDNSNIIFRAVVEYVGKFPDGFAPHENSKSTQREYIQTKHSVLKNVQKEVQCGKVTSDIFRKMKLKNSFNSPRDFNEVRNGKQKIKTKTEAKPNVADEYLEVLSMINKNEIIQEVIFTKGKPASIILYTDDQMADLNYCLLTNGIIGIDRTVNLGKCFATTIIFKNERLMGTESKKNPMFLGPIFLHWDGKTETYCKFFSHISAKVERNFDPDLKLNEKTIIGSDDEKALLKAIEICFPNARRYLCTKHLEDNVLRYLQDEVEMDAQTRQQAMRDIFGQKGIAAANSSFDFELRCHEFERNVAYEGFQNYFSKQLKSRLKNFVSKPRISTENKSISDKLWTNNDAESMNNIINLNINWTPQKLPALIQKLEGMVALQYAGVRASLHGNGNYFLAEDYTHFMHPHHVWVEKTDEEKDEMYRKFLMSNKVNKATKSSMVQATLADVLPPNCARIAAKPNQKRKAKATRTINCKKLKPSD